MVSLALLLSESDLDLLPRWLEWHVCDLWDEIIIVFDGNADDYTWSKALTVYSRHLENDFAAQRNFAMSKSKSLWTMFVDADEFILPEIFHQTSQFCQHPEAEIIGFPRINVTASEFLMKTYPDVQFRLVKKGIKWQNNTPYPGATPGCHETPVGKLGIAKEGHILHLKPSSDNFRQKGYTNDDEEFYIDYTQHSNTGIQLQGVDWSES